MWKEVDRLAGAQGIMDGGLDIVAAASMVRGYLAQGPSPFNLNIALQLDVA